MDSVTNSYRPPLTAAACALERMPHLAANIRTLWGRAEFEIYVCRLIMESRDGKRQGLPWDAAQELLFLVELSVAKRAIVAAELTGAPFEQMLALCRESSSDAAQSSPSVGEHRSDPTAHKQAGRMGRSQVHSKKAPAYDYRRDSEQTWWRRMFG